MLLLSRFWYLILSVAAVAATAAALLAQGTFNRNFDDMLTDQLRRDRLEIDAMLRVDARLRIDALAPLAADGEVHSKVREATAAGRKTGRIPSDINRQLRERLSSLNRQLGEMSGDLLMALDARGVVVAQLGPNEARFGGGFGTFPLVSLAMGGYLRDDVWYYEGSLYQMAARPVINAGRYAGAIVHGKKIDGKLSALLSKSLDGATVGFFVGDQIFGVDTPAEVAGAPVEGDIVAVLKDVLEDEGLLSQGLTGRVDLGEKGGAVFSLVTGSAAELRAGYFIARPRRWVRSPLELFSMASSEDVSELPWFGLGVAVLLLFGLGMLWLWIERDRPIYRLKREVAGLPERPVDRLNIGHWSGMYRQIVQSFNDSMDAAAARGEGGSAKKKAANLDELLSSGPEQAEPGMLPAAPRSPLASRLPASPGAPAPLGAALPFAAPSPAPSPGPLPKGPRPIPAPPAAAAPPPPPRARTTDPGARPTDPGARPTPTAPQPPAAAPAPAPKPPRAAAVVGGAAAADPLDDDDVGSSLDDDLPPDADATAVAQVPADLLKQTAEAAAASSGNSREDDEQAHFNEVFRKFVATKKECGEPTDDLTFERFVATLMKNREIILAKHSAKGVRFQVHVKGGKAALKATPVKH